MLEKGDKTRDYVVEIRPISPSSSQSSSFDEKERPLSPLLGYERGQSTPSWATTKQLLDCSYILLNTFSTVSIVFLNKLVFNDPQLRNCQISIAIWHLLATFLILYAATLHPFALFPAIRIPLASSLPLSFLFAGFLLLGNLSLAWNPIGFYQLSKVLNTPAVVLLSVILLGKTVARSVLAAVAAVCIGVTLTNSQLALSNPAGTTIAMAAVLVTALYQVWIAGKIQALEVSAPQLLLNQAALSVGLLVAVAPFVDVLPNPALIPARTLYALLASGILAALLNLSQFQVIARTSALTFNIVSNLKTIMIVSLSWYMDRYALTLRDAAGVTLALGGAYAYAQFAQRQR